jgi:hypothetical protein
VKLLLLFLLLLPATAEAFYAASTATSAIELTGSVRINAGGGRTPEITGVPDRLYDQDFQLSGAILRLILNARLGSTSLEVHAYQIVSGASGTAFLFAGADGFEFSEGGRFAGLGTRWYQRGGTTAELAFDRLNLRFDLGQIVFTVGRQPINLATTYFFTPNDFFQAFSATTFFRVYKPGVDAVRTEIQIGDFTQLTLLGVVGFDRTPGIEPSAGDRLSFDASSVLARFATSFLDFEWSVLGGKAPGYFAIGGGLQGELFQWLGVRAEGHYRFGDDGRPGTVELAGGLEHRFESSLHLRFEQFYHGSGKSNPSAYLEAPIDPNLLTGPLYLGRHYSALGASYEVTPLLNADGVLLFNWTDRSFSISLYAVYSLLDEVEASLAISIPIGPDPSVSGTSLVLGSELGAQPITALGELRAYF